MTEGKTSHDLANNLRELADRLTAKPPFALENIYYYLFLNFYKDKAGFIATAKAVGGTKSVNERDYELVQRIGVLEVTTKIPRSAVCRLVKPAQEAVYECEALLSPEEEQSIAAVEV